MIDPLRLAASLPFSTGSGVTWECLDSPVPDIHVTQFEAGAEVGFDGTVTPICTARASIDVPVVGVEDVSGQVESGVLDKVNAAMQDPQVVSFLAADRVRSYLDIFSRLLRLDAQAQIQAYRSDGTTLFVDYIARSRAARRPHVPVVEVGPPSTLTPSHRGEPAPPPPRFTPRRLRFIRRSRVLIRMSYPVTLSTGQSVPVSGSWEVPFHPAAAGFVNVVVVATGIQPPPPCRRGRGGGGTTSHPPPPFNIGLRVDVVKPGAATPAASESGRLHPFRSRRPGNRVM